MATKQSWDSNSRLLSLQCENQTERGDGGGKVGQDRLGKPSAPLLPEVHVTHNSCLSGLIPVRYQLAQREEQLLQSAHANGHDDEAVWTVSRTMSLSSLPSSLEESSEGKQASSW